MRVRRGLDRGVQSVAGLRAGNFPPAVLQLALEMRGLLVELSKPRVKIIRARLCIIERCCAENQRLLELVVPWVIIVRLRARAVNYHRGLQ